MKKLRILLKYPLRKIMEKYDQDIAWRNEKIGFEWDGERF